MISEILVAATKDEGALLVYDAQSLAHLGSFKGNQCDTHGLTPVYKPNSGGRIMSLLASQSDKSFFHEWQMQKELIRQKFLLTEKITAVSVSLDGLWMVGGSMAGELFVWDLLSGDLTRQFRAHYKRITAVRFSCDGEFVVTASEDATIQVLWIAELVDQGVEGHISPFRSLNEHSLAVTDIQVGSGTGAGSARLVSSSLDRTCKIWDMLTGTCLATLVFPSVIHCVLLDVCETCIWAGCQDGNIYEMDLYQGANREDPLHQVIQTALPETTHVNPYQDKVDHQHTLKGTGSAVQNLALSMDTCRIYAGYTDGQIQVWDRQTRQVLKSIHPFKSSVTALLVLQRPFDLFSHAIDPHAMTQGMPPLKNVRRVASRLENNSNAGLIKIELSGFESDTLNENVDTNTAKYLEEMDSQVPLKVDCEKIRLELDEARERYSTLRKQYQQMRQLNDNLSEFCAQHVVSQLR